MANEVVNPPNANPPPPPQPEVNEVERIEETEPQLVDAAAAKTLISAAGDAAELTPPTGTEDVLRIENERQPVLDMEAELGGSEAKVIAGADHPVQSVIDNPAAIVATGPKLDLSNPKKEVLKLRKTPGENDSGRKWRTVTERFKTLKAFVLGGRHDLSGHTIPAARPVTMVQVPADPTVTVAEQTPLPGNVTTMPEKKVQEHAA